MEEDAAITKRFEPPGTPARDWQGKLALAVSRRFGEGGTTSKRSRRGQGFELMLCHGKILKIKQGKISWLIITFWS